MTVSWTIPMVLLKTQEAMTGERKSQLEFAMLLTVSSLVTWPAPC